MGNERQLQKVQQKAKAAFERIDDVEKTLGGIVESVNAQGKTLGQVITAINKGMGQLEQSLEEYKEMLNAVIGILGPAQVQAEIANNRKILAERQVAEVKEGIVGALAAGDIVPAQVTSEKSFVAGVECNADGTVVPPGWAFVPMSKIEEEFRKQLIGQPVGFKITTKVGGTFELLEIYEAVEKPVVAEEVAPVEAPAVVETEPVAAEPTAPDPVVPVAAPEAQS